MFWPFLGNRATGYTQQYEIWHEAFMDKIINIQEKTIKKTIMPLFFILAVKLTYGLDFDKISHLTNNICCQTNKLQIGYCKCFI